MYSTDKIIKTYTPVARKNHICEVCGKPILIGEKYSKIVVKRKGKLINCNRHIGCGMGSNHIEQAQPVPHYLDEQSFKAAVHLDTLNMLNTFSLQENMEIAFAPLIIAEVAWHYTFIALKKSADRRISKNIKISREIKNLREFYISECSKDLDRSHFKKLDNISEEFIKESSKDIFLLWFTLNTELKKNWYHIKDLDIVTDACVALVILEFLKKYDYNTNKMIAEHSNTIIPIVENPSNKKLNKLLNDFISPAKVVFNQHIEIAIGILNNKIKKIDYGIK